MDIKKHMLTATFLLFAHSAMAADTAITAVMKSGGDDFTRYCASCHGDVGQGKIAPALKGNTIVTGKIEENIKTVVSGVKHTQMPSWGKTELSDEVLADIITYTRNAWGNNDKEKYGKQAGGTATAKMVQEQRDKIEHKSVPGNKRL